MSLPPSSGSYRGLQGDAMMSPHRAGHTEGAKHYLCYFRLLPLFRQRCIVSEPKLADQQPCRSFAPKLATTWEKSFFLEKEDSSQRGDTCHKSSTSWASKLLNQKKNKKNKKTSGWDRKEQMDDIVEELDVVGSFAYLFDFMVCF